MKLYNITNIIHIENDVLLYKNFTDYKFHTHEKILLTMDSKNRCIPGIIFIPNCELLQKCLNNFKQHLNDMENLSLCYYNLNSIIDTLPIFIDNIIPGCDSQVFNIVTKNFKHYNSIFDAAAIGQYLGGVDPKNIQGDTSGFVNETCIIDYSKYGFLWKKNIDNMECLFIKINNTEYYIINLHIHCKNLKKFSN